MSSSAVVLTPVRADLRWKFSQIGAGPGEQVYTRYDLKLDEKVRRRHLVLFTVERLCTPIRD